MLPLTTHTCKHICTCICNNTHAYMHHTYTHTPHTCTHKLTCTHITHTCAHHTYMYMHIQVHMHHTYTCTPHAHFVANIINYLLVVSWNEKYSAVSGTLLDLLIRNWSP